MATGITNYTTSDLEEQARFNDGALKGQVLYRQCYQGKVVRPRDQQLQAHLCNVTREKEEQ